MEPALEFWLNAFVTAYDVAHPCSRECENEHWGTPHYGDPRLLSKLIERARELVN